MAYGTQARVLFYLGRNDVDTIYFTAANIAIAIADADIWVDDTNDEAADNNKIAASSAYAAYILRNNFVLNLIAGTSSSSQTEREPTKWGNSNYLRELALIYLRDNELTYRRDFQIT